MHLAGGDVSEPVADSVATFFSLSLFLTTPESAACVMMKMTDTVNREGLPR